MTNRENNIQNSGKKILYGVCGIGMGHANRQTPLIEHFVASGARVLIFAYGESLKLYRQRFADCENVRVERVSIPFFVGNQDGLDFVATAKLEANNREDHAAINCAALAVAQEWLGQPDLTITDYEPVSASYAYACASPLVTIDQQSKYLVGAFPEKLGGQGFKDETARLRMFFPKADARLACSFFQVEKNSSREEVDIVPPVLKDDIVELAAKRQSPPERSILVYLSSQRDFVQSIDEVASICGSYPEWQFHIFAPSAVSLASPAASNVKLLKHGDDQFNSRLRECAGIVTTGGHTLLSEAMHMNIPAYVIPLAVYEQHMNAHVIDASGFGMSREKLTAKDLAEFLANIPNYTRAIGADKKVLMRGTGQAHIIAVLERMLNAD